MNTKAPCEEEVNTMEEEHDLKWFGYDVRRPNKEERAQYKQEIEKSQGFDVSDYPNVAAFGMIIPINYRGWEDSIEFCIDLAIKQYNSIVKLKKKKIKFERIVKVNALTGGLITWFITFEATNIANGLRTYQAKVIMPVPIEDSEVELVRLKPGQKE